MKTWIMFASSLFFFLSCADRDGDGCNDKWDRPLPTREAHKPAPACGGMAPQHCCTSQWWDRARGIFVCQAWACTDDAHTCFRMGGHPWSQNDIDVTQRYVESTSFLCAADAGDCLLPVRADAWLEDGGIEEDGGVELWDGGAPGSVPLSPNHYTGE